MDSQLVPYEFQTSFATKGGKDTNETVRSSMMTENYEFLAFFELLFQTNRNIFPTLENAINEQLIAQFFLPAIL